MINSEEEVSMLGASMGQSSCSSSAERTSLKMEDEDSRDTSQVFGSKRMLSIDDPDYMRPPDVKRMREMHKRAEDELSERVVKVVDKEFHYAMTEKQAEMEEIDNRILRLQQCLHTLRYCVSLNYYAVNKTKDVDSKQKQMLHPAVRKHLGKAPVKSAGSSSPFPNSPVYQSFGRNKLPHGEYKESVEKGSVKEEHADMVESVERFSSETDRISSDHREIQEATDGKCKDLSDTIDEDTNKNFRSPRPPSPKYLPPKPPDNPHTIFQGRHQRFQSKRRVVVGNTYQYLTSHGDEDVGDALRYKWQVYVRAPMEGEDVSTFISAVTFILDQSYAPHHIITLKHPPFVLTRRGWGEFKIQIVLRFTDTRNKQVKLLHPLVLSRQDDPLALTGLWRLGQEKWYDLWVYEPGSERTTNISGSQQTTQLIMKEENCPATLVKELETGVVSSQIEENITIVHSVEQKSTVDCVKQTTPVKQESVKKVIISSDKNTIIKNVRKKMVESVASCKQLSLIGTQCENEVSGDVIINKVYDEKREKISTVESKIKLEGTEENKAQGLKPPKDHLGDKMTNVNGAQGKVCKIHVRQPDGRLVPYYIPAHMYSLALKIAQGGANKQENEVDALDSKLVNQHGIVSKHNVSQKIIKLHVPEKQQKGDTEGFTIKQEPSEILTHQREGSKVVTLEVKAEVEQDNTKVSGTPIKILNFSPNKNAVKDNGGSMNMAPSTSGIQGVSRPSHVTQGNQTIARLSTSRLSQRPLQQLLVKAAIQDKKHTLVKQLLNKKGLKGGAGDTLHMLQGQVTYTQTPVGLKSNIQVMPLKIVQEVKNSSSTSTRFIQRPLSTANIKFITNNGQLISAGKLAKGKTCSDSSQVTSSMNMATSSAPTVSSCILTTSNNTSALTTVQGSQQVAGSSGLQLVTSKGKMTPTQHPPMIVCSNAGDTGTVLQIPPFVVRGMGNDGALKPTSNSVKCTPSNAKNMTAGVSLLRGITMATSPTVCSLLKPLTNTTNSGVTSTTSVLNNVQTKVTSNSPVIKSLSFNASSDKTNIAFVKMETVSEDRNKEEDGSTSQEWEERVRQLEAVCKRCTSTDKCVYVWVRALPLDQHQYKYSQVLPFCAKSREEFLCWPLGKQRAAEFQRAREVKHHLDQYQVSSRESWSVGRIVAWARRHAHTPTPPRAPLRTDQFSLSVSTKPEKTLSYLGNLEKLVQDVDNCMPVNGQVGLQEVDVVTIDDDVKTSCGHKLSVSPQKCPLEFVPWEDSEMVSGCEWVGQHTSQLRLNLSTEEVLTGYTADVARATSWRAMLCLMEDLLRSSHCEAWGDTLHPTTDSTLVPPQEITLHHVLSALTNARPEFDIFTDYGLGTPIETTCINNAQ
ncbi:YEATS domain-containing protein 2-like isoform X2 [Homarus americanus]|uniref:YEATS domain-containing protein 2-like isoform X2 n=1 Tax=Homarus americanus TaxID=6706 RepID=UPI001C436ED5|nr:YEATS domain-containing protein 2-like isoform X2 [Homarus americanus]